MQRFASLHVEHSGLHGLHEVLEFKGDVPKYPESHKHPVVESGVAWSLLHAVHFFSSSQVRHSGLHSLHDDGLIKGFVPKKPCLHLHPKLLSGIAFISTHDKQVELSRHVRQELSQQTSKTKLNPKGQTQEEFETTVIFSGHQQ
jgi:hypothetical protein